MKRLTYSLALAASLILTGCSEDTFSPDDNITDDQKGLIDFTTSVETGGAASSAMTRAGFTGGREYTSQASGEYSTQIVARFSSINSSSQVRHTKTALTAGYDAAAEKGAHWESCSNVQYSTGMNRYWDDAWGRDAKLSIYAVAVPNKTDVQNNSTTLYNLVPVGSTNVSANNTNWQTDTETDAMNSIAWQVSTTQTDDFSGTIANEDLCYSHNIQNDNDSSDPLHYGKGKDGVRIWGTHDAASDYPSYSYIANPGDGDHYPTLDDGQMQFHLTNRSGPNDGPGHFDKGHMIFHHATTRITVNLKKSTDDGFKEDGTDFVLTDDLITLLNMHYKGTLNIKNGTWSAYTEGTHDDNANIKMASTTKNAGMDYTNFAQVIPGYVLDKNSNVNVMSFTVSDNTYYITQAQLFKALDEGTVNAVNNKTAVDHNGNKYVTVTDNKITLEQGKNYVFTITVKKTGIQAITATLVPWVEVTGNADGHNDYVKISLMDKKSTNCEHFDLYRMNDDQTEIYAPTTGPGTGTTWTPNYNWLGTAGTAASQNYKDKATLTSLGSGKWKTNWFWESNKSFYHIRSVNEGVAVQANTTTTADYFNIFSGPISDTWTSTSNISTAVNDKKFNDYHWGAPFKPGQTLTYNPTYGWSAATASSGQIYPAIGSTSQDINIIEQHMMANIHIVLHTGTDAAGNAVAAGGAIALKDAGNKATRITLTNFYGSGEVRMGDGKITQTGSLINSDIPVPGASVEYGGDNVLTDASMLVANNADYYKTATTQTKEYSFRVVPQSLYRGSNASTETNLDNFIGLTLVSPDNNQYYMIKKLYDVTAETITNANGKTEHTQGQPIHYWYPGYDYTYHIYLNKTGIVAITCSVVDWVYVTGANTDLDLED